MEQHGKYFTDECLQALNEAYKYCRDNQFDFITVDSFMMFIAQTAKGKEIVEAMGLDLNHYLTSVKTYLQEHSPKNSTGQQPHWTIQLRELRDQAVILQQAAGNTPKVDEGFIFVALYLLEDESYTRNYFETFNVTRFHIMSFIAHGERKENGNEAQQKDNSKNALHKYAILLNKKAKEGRIDQIVGREKEIERTIEILCQRRKNNPILVGEPGVGKTAIAEGLAKRIADGNVPASIANFQIYSLDLTAVLAGTKYRGEFEERLKQVIKEASSNPNIVLVIDEIHTLVGTGSSSGSMDASNILKPSLSSGELKVIGATTYDEYRKYFESEGALARRFQKVEIEEPTPAQALDILRGLKTQYEEFHGVKYTEQALESAVQLTVKYVNDRRLPDKALDVIDTAGSKMKLAENITDKTITEEKIKEIVSLMARIPVDAVKETEKQKLQNLEPSLKAEVFGQDDAVEKTVNSIIYARSSLSQREKPIGSFLFAGPSGVGKTELAKQLSFKLGVPFIRFDMSEYMEKHAVARLIGAPPGYAGFDQGGQLIEAIRKNPNSVLLFDEIEKAHPDIFNIFLQVMDYATLTDNSGRKADFKNVVLIMTTNLGAAEISKAKIGFTKSDTVVVDRETQVKKHFRPEFYNRLDSVVQFSALDNENILKVIGKQTKKLQQVLLEKKVVSIFTTEAMQLIAKEGFDPAMGARPIERYIEKNISQVLAREVLFGKLEQGGEIKIDVKDGKLEIKYLHSYADDAKVVKKTVPSLTDVPLPKKRKKKEA